MALCNVDFWANSLGKWVAMNVLIPDGKGPFPVLYLLHGFSDDHTMWCRRSNVERKLEGKGLICVMPDGAKSFYCNDERTGGAGKYEDHLSKDIVQFVDNTFHTVADRRGRAIAGLSMGGFGATMLAFAHPDIYCAACSHSGAVGFGHNRKKDPNIVHSIAGILQAKYDCHVLARKAMAGRNKVAYRFDCGVDDFLIEENRAYHRYLEKIGMPHEYVEHPGAHTWDYWDEHIQQTIEFVLKNVKKK